ncbi:MAG: TerB family tellurite resistance protein [Rivularia sp. (in: cyanobacteria)]
MDKFQAVFEILIILSGIDGDIDRREIQVIDDFIESNIGEINFDPQAVVENLSKLKGEGFLEEFSYAAIVFKNQTGVEDRLTILQFAIELIRADGEITDDEFDLLLALGELWNIDMEEFLN